jgi:hypothetical protein
VTFKKNLSGACLVADATSASELVQKAHEYLLELEEPKEPPTASIPSHQ